MLRKIFTAIIAASSFVFTSAQTASVEPVPAAGLKTEAEETEKKTVFSVTGSADAYYRYDFAKTKANNFTSFTNSHNSFALGMASVKFEHKTDKVGAVLDLGFGARASEFAYNDDGLLQAVKQLYVTYSPAGWIKFTAGTWATHVGYELLDPQLNRNYSMSYLFTNGPFSHTGLKADITKGNHVFMLGVSNATDYRILPDGQINKKFLIAQYSLAAGENVKLYLNYAGGKAPDSSISSQFDLVVSSKISDKFNIGVNGTINNTQLWDGAKNLSGKSWGGATVYLNFDPQSWFGITARGEYFSDKNQLKVFSAAPAGGSIFATTLSANFKINTFTIIPELRLDNASENIFTGKNGSAKSSAAGFLIAAVYSF
jgi:hypothetical protein